MFSLVIVPALCLCLILNFAASQLTTDVCPPHFTRDQYLQVRGDRCYQFVVYRRLTHSAARAECEKNGGGLAKIKDQDTQNYLHDQVLHTYNHPLIRLWIGLSDIARENNFVWDDGTKPNYTHWAIGEGSGVALNHDANDCVAMDMPSNGQWRVFPCDVGTLFLILHPEEAHYFICEYPIQTATTGAVVSVAAHTDAPVQPTTPGPLGADTSLTHSCPALLCSLDCGVHGFKQDSTGCIVCECAA